MSLLYLCLNKVEINSDIVMYNYLILFTAKILTAGGCTAKKSVNGMSVKQPAKLR